MLESGGWCALRMESDGRKRFVVVETIKNFTHSNQPFRGQVLKDTESRKEIGNTIEDICYFAN